MERFFECEHIEFKNDSSPALWYCNINQGKHSSVSYPGKTICTPNSRCKYYMKKKEIIDKKECRFIIRKNSIDPALWYCKKYPNSFCKPLFRTTCKYYSYSYFDEELFEI